MRMSSKADNIHCITLYVQGVSISLHRLRDIHLRYVFLSL